MLSPIDLWKRSWNSSLFALITRETFEPAHEIMVPITLATSEGSGEPANSHSLGRTFAVSTHKV